MRRMPELSLASFVALSATFLAAGWVKGVTGMGLPTVAMGVLGAWLSPVVAASLLVIPSFVTNLWQMLAGPAAPRLWRRLWPMMAGIVLGTTLGAGLLVRADAAWSAAALGTALIAYACCALAMPRLSIAPRAERWLSPVAGALTGGITGATGVFVIPAVPFLQSLNLEKDELVQALGLSFTVSTLAMAAGLLSHGALRMGQLGLSAYAILPALAGMWLGQCVRHRIAPKTFRLCFLLFLLLLGIELVSRPWR